MSAHYISCLNRTIANNAEIDVIWENYKQRLEPLRDRLNAAVGEAWEEWDIPREADDGWSDAAKNSACENGGAFASRGKLKLINPSRRRRKSNSLRPSV